MGKSNSARRGSGSEALVRNVLNHLKAKGVITDFRRAKPKDTPGYDFSIELPSSRNVFLQVKSSNEACGRHRERYPDIPCVVVPKHPLDWATWSGRKQATRILTERILTALGISSTSI